ncbi:vitamin B12 transporter [Ectothiorhodosinus mongolicus]|uniref:Vitamin B12 transporter n=1 Tax=Ectothiorhodosinus mongolicus TaxID=233100 RepID=A0A1R3W4T8_9GAMM|nr:TonB-dependent receptor [Ectothiorhodosinus mongolicus]ULX57550.1 TonB-dependent receptor [Ectothiorhodosinus mongolicus]SIT72756.1 vitamin B12 transporter [Ectothiorhodosinus mongolicus]
MKKSLLMAGLAAATSAAVAEPIHFASLDPIVVTPTRTAQTVDASLASVTVIERAEIDRLQPRSFADLLRSRAGIDIAQNGAFGQQTSVFLRGTNSNSVVLLVDGVRVSSATTGAPAWEFLPVDQIDRVEIVRGPRSSLYGADAIGGIIQVFTRQGDGPARLRGHVGGGSFNTREGSLGIAGSSQDTRYNFSVSRYQSDGIDVLTGVGDDRADGITSNNLSARIDHQVDERLGLFASLLYSQGEADFDRDVFEGFVARREPLLRDWNDFTLASLSVGANIAVSEHWDAQISLAQSRDERETFVDEEFDSRINTRRDIFTWSNALAVNSVWDAVVGIDYQRDTVNATTSYDETSRYNWGGFAQLQGALGAHNLIGSLRYDDNEAYGSKTTGQVAWGYDLSESWQTRVSYGTAFRAPTFNDLFFPDDPTFGPQSNPDLKPEASRNLEFGVRYSQQDLAMDLVIFQTDIEDLIIFDGIPQNVDKARIRGLEFELIAELDDWRLGSTLTLLDHENRANGNELPRRPNASARLDVDRIWNGWTYGVSATAQGRSYDDVVNNNRISGFGLLDLRASYALTSNWMLRAKVANVLDNGFITVLDFGGDPLNQPGRAYYLSLHYQQ